MVQTYLTQMYKSNSSCQDIWTVSDYWLLKDVAASILSTIVEFNTFNSLRLLVPSE